MTDIDDDEPPCELPPFCDICDKPTEDRITTLGGQPICAASWEESDECRIEREAKRAFEATFKGAR